MPACLSVTLSCFNYPPLQPVGDEAAADIDKDLGRTFPTLKRFAAADGQEALRRVLRAYAALDPEVRGFVNIVIMSEIHVLLPIKYWQALPCW
jgi:hypothetical protein